MELQLFSEESEGFLASILSSQFSAAKTVTVSSTLTFPTLISSPDLTD